MPVQEDTPRSSKAAPATPRETPKGPSTAAVAAIGDHPHGRLHLLVISDRLVASYPLPDSGEISIGRAPTSDVSIDEDSISRTHAILAVGPPLTIRDLSSVNGTRVRDKTLEPGRAARVFELRVYEARNLRASLTKIKMFEEGEIAIFRKTGLIPVFFGQTVVGTGLPSLTYMLAYDSVEAREENWRKFIGHPDWIKLRAMPGYSDAEIVSNIHSCFLRPTNYSPIR